ncbi:hypothetical protein ABT354_20025 [Streptomyces sp. NPDC000594]|uniref:hypothetical protein n=1 Tax=Streptomyces sp. NPDC000594 TaxID=3154261 RepID=UPI00331A65BF
MATTADAVNAFLAEQANDGHIETLRPVIRKRREALRIMRVSALKVGDEITTAEIRPKYFAGLNGTLTHISAPSRGSRQSTVIRLDAESTQRLRQRYWIPEDEMEYQIDVIPLAACFLKGTAPAK